MNAPSYSEQRRLRLLQQIGIGAVWVQRSAPMPAKFASVDDSKYAPSDGSVANAATIIDPLPMHAPAALPTASAWDAPSAAAPMVGFVASGPSDAEIAAMDWSRLQSAVASCRRCALCQTREHAVFGSGDERGNWLLVGEGPGRSEDSAGLPFVGPAGKLLDNMLRAIALTRDANLFITNAVKCRAVDANGNDRAPSAEESAACRPYLQRQIALQKPATIVALGRVAAQALLDADPKTPLAALRGTLHRFHNIPVVVTYHPAYLLRKPLDKAQSWRDLCMATEAFAGVGELPV
ncbi:MAG: uracil-DNA glycosylase [Pseudomonadota bacterium]|nr:uracil-DNA glycosylase [Pseudomonadota bacterium]